MRAKNGWTLWSFQKRQVLEAWQSQIVETGQDAIYVFCSEGIGAADPPNEPAACKSYRLIGDDSWNPLPEAISTPSIALLAMVLLAILLFDVPMSSTPR